MSIPPQTADIATPAPAATIDVPAAAVVHEAPSSSSSSSSSSSMPAKRVRMSRETVRLSNGQEMPSLGLGTWQATDAKELHLAVVEAIETYGYRHIDCAPVYGNEAVVGAALKEVLAKGKVKRSDLFVVSKLWNTNHHPDHVRPALEQTLKDLQLDYIDLYLIHWPVAFEHTGIPLPPALSVPKDNKGYIKFAKVPLQDTYRAMEQLVDAGLTKSIGVSNYRVIDILVRSSFFFGYLF